MGNKLTKGFNRMMIIIIVAIILVAGIGGYVYYSKFMTKSDDQQIAALEKAIGKLIILPVGEKPVLATIKDAESLAKQQPFFVGAKNGDKLLVYTNARKAFIYSEETGKLVNVGPIVYDQNAQAPAKAPETVQTTKTTVTSASSTSSTKKK